MFKVVRYQRRNGFSPFDEYVADVKKAGRKKDLARIHDFVERLEELGQQRMVEMDWAEDETDPPQLRPGRDRIFYCWDAHCRTYALLNGFLKKTRKTPERDLKKAQSLVSELLADHKEGRTHG